MLKSPLMKNDWLLYAQHVDTVTESRRGGIEAFFLSFDLILMLDFLLQNLFCNVIMSFLIIIVLHIERF